MKALYALASILASLVFLVVTISPASAAQPVIRVQSFPHPAGAAQVGPGLVQGIVGVGLGVPGFDLPCIGCYGALPGTLVLPPPFQVIRRSEEGQEILYLYCTVETGSGSGVGSFSFEVTEASTGNVVESGNAGVALQANSTNLIVVYGNSIPDLDRYNGVEVLTFTTTLRNATVQGSLDLFMPY